MTDRPAYCGPADLGIAGQESWFQRHVCNEYCCSDWIKPRTTRKAVFRESNKRTTTLKFDSAAHQSIRTPEAPTPRFNRVTETPQSVPSISLPNSQMIEKLSGSVIGTVLADSQRSRILTFPGIAAGTSRSIGPHRLLERDRVLVSSGTFELYCVEKLYFQIIANLSSCTKDISQAVQD